MLTLAFLTLFRQLYVSIYSNNLFLSRMNCLLLLLSLQNGDGRWRVSTWCIFHIFCTRIFAFIVIVPLLLLSLLFLYILMKTHAVLPQVVWQQSQLTTNDSNNLSLLVFLNKLYETRDCGIYFMCLHQMQWNVHSQITADTKKVFCISISFYFSFPSNCKHLKNEQDEGNVNRI